MSYKRNVSNNRDALFGGSGGGSAGKSTPKIASTTSTSTSSSGTGYNASRTRIGTSRGGDGCIGTKTTNSGLTGAAREAKLLEAKDYQQKANTCMERGFFKKADPISACTFYKRSADAYKAIGDNTNERYMRISSGDTNMMCTAYASAASDYTRAAELILLSLNDIDIDDDNTITDKKAGTIRHDASTYHKKAAHAWKQMNEHGKSATSMVSAAIALNSTGTNSKSNSNSTTGRRILSKDALGAIEVAIESFVPDPLNAYSRYRQTGVSAFIDDNTDETVETCSAETKEFAKQHLVTSAYSHEPIQQLIDLLIQYGEYASALYACGAVTCLLEADGVSTLSLSRAYVTETIITLAMGDPILAEQQFLSRHVQKTFYLSSRECQLAEELFRAVKDRDIDALDAARNPTGPNRSALANLSNNSIRQLVQELRISGVARTKTTTAVPKDSSGPVGTSTTTTPTTTDETAKSSLNSILQMKTGYEQDGSADGDDHHLLDSTDLANELDNLDFDDSDDENDNKKILGCGDDELDALEDDDLDLR